MADKKEGRRQARKRKREFYKKVCIILTIQLTVVTMVMCHIFFEKLKRRVADNFTIYVTSLILFVSTTVFIIFCTSVTEKYPYNYVFISSLTIITAFWCSCICAKYPKILVLLSFFIAVATCSVLITYAIKTRNDFTGFMGLLLIATLIALLLCILFFLAPSSQLKWIILVGSVILTSAYLVVDVQMIEGGPHKYKLTPPNNHVLAASLLFVDVIYVFIYFVMMIGDIPISSPKPVKPKSEDHH